MVARISVLHNGTLLEPRWYNPEEKGLKVDRYGKIGGYRVHPSGPGHNKSENALFYKSLDDVAQLLLANPDWGLRFVTLDGDANIFYDGITINGVPR